MGDSFDVPLCDVCLGEVLCEQSMSVELLVADEEDPEADYVLIRCWGCARRTCVSLGGDA